MTAVQELIKELKELNEKYEDFANDEAFQTAIDLAEQKLEKEKQMIKTTYIDAKVSMNESSEEYYNKLANPLTPKQ